MRVSFKSFQLLLILILIGASTLQAQQFPQGTPAKNVTDAELKQFIDVAKKFQEISIATDRMLFSKLEEVGMSGERFQEIMMSKQDPNATKIQLSVKEKRTISGMEAYLERLSASVQQQQMEVVEKSELSKQRFQAIAMAIQTDQELAKRFQALAGQ